ncbi:hypothetical protein [Streptomyces sp. V3I8]|jgi:hypothetical protein|uniref:hypothetical protein n=1 Tax=Streptomyces sp. V3I8 TaxID=3042279 RepID=UPI0027D8FB97|nr:hypothetical protein [Streptomyces sp. V3I8]
MTLATVGLVFLLGGAWLAVTQASWATGLPAWWPDPGPRTALVDRQGLAELRTTDWWTPSVLAGAIAATALFGVWSARQLRSGVRPSVPLPAPGSTLRTRALEDAVTRQALAIEGVARCRTRALARKKRLGVRLHVRLQPDVTPAAVLPALVRLAAQTEAALTPYEVGTRVRFSTRPHSRRHVR